MTEHEIASAVAKGAQLKREISTRTEELKAIEAQLIAQGAGTYAGPGGADGSRTSATVIKPNAGIKPSADDIEACKDIAGDHFAKLFEKKTVFIPVDAFRQVAAALLSKPKCAKIIAQVEKAGSAFVKWAK